MARPVASTFARRLISHRTFSHAAPQACAGALEPPPLHTRPPSLPPALFAPPALLPILPISLSHPRLFLHPRILTPSLPSTSTISHYTTATTANMGQSNIAAPSPAPLTSTVAADVDLSRYDDEQVKLMEEMCIVIDRDDKRIGANTKKACHLMTNIMDHNLLHRAFSVFLFSADGTKLLLQQRATEKITFPDAWTNTCCSHPLNTADELVEKDNLGVRTAAQRKLFHELGIEAEDVPVDQFHFLTRIHYLAPSNETWGEHEIDYILFMRPQHKDYVDMKPSPNEVRDVRWVTKEELKVLLNQGVTPGSGIIVTPWFKLICDNFMFAWWDKMMAEGGVDKVAQAEEVEKIYRL